MTRIGRALEMETIGPEARRHADTASARGHLIRASSGHLCYHPATSHQLKMRSFFTLRWIEKHHAVADQAWEYLARLLHAVRRRERWQELSFFWY
jgi:hypothetical protein